MEGSEPSLAVNKLKQQNEKLKAELQELSGVLQEAVKKRKQAETESKRPNFSSVQDRELTSLYVRINKLKRERDTLKMQISANADNNTIELENRLVFLKKQLLEAEDEKRTLLKLQQDQEKTLNNMQNSESVAERTGQLRDNTRKARDDYRALLNQMKTEEVQWKQDHKRMVALEEKIREAKNRQKRLKEESKRPPAKSKQENELEELSRKIEVLRVSIASEEKKGKRLVAEAENGLKLSSEEETALQQKVQGKEEEIQLKELKLKELKTTVKNLQAKFTEQSNNTNNLA